MNKRWAAAYGATALLVAWHLYGLVSGGAPQKMYDRIEPGMSEVRVREVIGRIHGDHIVSPHGYYGAVEPMEAGDHPKHSFFRTWYFDEGVIVVKFSTSKTVLWKKYEESKRNYSLIELAYIRVCRILPF